MRKRLGKVLRVLVSLTLALTWLLFSSTPAYAIVNPDTISFGTGTTAYYKVFYNVLESGDWLIAAEGYVYYIVEPTDYLPKEAFIFELLNTAGNDTIASTSLKAWGDRPIGIYLTAAQVTSAGLSVGTAYIVRIMGSPLIFASPTGNSVNAILTPLDFIDQELGADGGVPTANNLRNGMITVAENMEDNDTPVDSYLVTVQGYRYLSLDGGDLFIVGINGIQSMCPILFQAGVEPMTSDAPQNTGAYALTLTPAQKWGNTVANGLTMLGSYMGINQALAGSVVLFAIVIAFAVYIYQKTESGITVLLMVAATPFLGAYLGLMPMAVAFIVVIFIITLMGYFFFSRGAL